MKAITQVLQQYWGYDTFRPLQREAIECVFNHQDSVVVLPTGGGKSLCYQVPAVAMDGMALIISPLIALMKDQVDALRQCGIPAACINSSLSDVERRQIATDIRGNRLKLLYVAPERVVTERFVDYLRETPISFIAIDEAHCISMWGHDFRPEYRALRQLKQAYSTASVHAYTATATPQVREDIARELALDSAAFHVGSFDRPNLAYRVQRRTKLMNQLTAIIEKHRNESGIVYCIRRKDVDELCIQLREKGYNARPYHAGMADLHRKQNQEAFLQEDIDIIVATVAFGMGIDKSNVRYVVHAGMPKSLEHYQQESGRGGRDGLDAECHLLYAPSDYGLWKSIITGSEEAGADIALRKLNDIYSFCTGVTCRHQAIVRYFGQNLQKDSCNACDVCLEELDTLEDGETIAARILRCVVELDQFYGAAYVSQVLTGSRDQRILDNHHDTAETWGALKQYSQAHVRQWIDQIIAQEYMEAAGEYGVLHLTAAGRASFRGDAECPPIKLLAPGTASKPKAKAAPKSKLDWEGVDEGLFEELRDLRREVAREQQVPAYVIFGDAALRDMARLRPSTRSAFLMVRGVGKQKAEKYAKKFLPAIRTFSEMHSLEMNVGLEIDLIGEEDSCEPPPEGLVLEILETGVKITDAANQLNQDAAWISEILVNHIQQHGHQDASDWLEEDILFTIENAAQRAHSLDDAAVFPYVRGTVSYEELQVGLACMRNRGGE